MLRCSKFIHNLVLLVFVGMWGFALMACALESDTNPASPIPPQGFDERPPEADGDRDDGGGDLEDWILPPRWEKLGRGPGQWSEFVYDQLDIYGQSLLAYQARDIKEFCASYDELDSVELKNFWLYLISTMTELESSHRPEAKYQENFRDSQGNYVISRGLLQLSIESANSYGCRIRQAQQLHDPYVNLSCGIRILNRWVEVDGVLSQRVSGRWRGAARYWSIFRKARTLRQIKSWTQALEFCRPS